MSLAELCAIRQQKTNLKNLLPLCPNNLSHFLNDVRRVIQLRHYSIRTERSYVNIKHSDPNGT